MGDNLYGGSQIFPLSFFIDHRLVDFACRHVGGFGQIFVNETFIVSQIKIRFRAVISDKDLAVLVRTHGTGIDIDIRVKFLNGNFVPSVFRRRPREAAVMPFPKDETTPPVTKIYFVMVPPLHALRCGNTENRKRVDKHVLYGGDEAEPCLCHAFFNAQNAAFTVK